jgi:hypothetical protein
MNCQSGPKNFFSTSTKIRSNIWVNAADDGKQEHIIGIDFCSYSSKKVKITKFGIFRCFAKYVIFQLNLWTIYLPIGTIFEAEIFTVDTTFRALQDEILFNQFGEHMYFHGRKPME